MIKRIVIFMRKELISATRNNLILYTILFPLILALGFKLFIPSVQSMKLTVALDANAEQKVITGFMKYARVELFDTPALVMNRVEKPDDVGGIIRKGNRYVIVLEGNEGAEAESVASALLNTILSDKPVSRFEDIDLHKDNSSMKVVSASLLILCAVMIGGFITGINLIDEKESKAIKALAVSPLRMYELISAHALLCLIIAVVLAAASSYILIGPTVNYVSIALAVISSTGISILLGYLIGGLADNLISAIGVIKILVFIILGVPIGSVFVPQNMQWVFYVFPHYWSFQAYQNIFNDYNQAVSFELSCLIALASSIAFIILLKPVLNKSLKLR